MKLFFQDESTVSLRNVYRGQLHPCHVVCPPRPAHGLVYYFKGRNVFHYQDRQLVCQEGMVLFLPQGFPYTIDRLDEGEIIVVDFKTSGQFLSDPFCKKASVPSPLPECFQKLLALWRRQSVWDKSEMLSLFWQTVGAVQRLNVQSYLPEDQLRKIAPAVEYMEEHFDRPDVRVCDLAALCGMSERYFLHLFQAYLSVSPKEFLIRLRLDQARQLLIAENLSISDIAQRCGFSDLFYFSRLFRKKTGLSPTEYRKKYVLSVNALGVDREKSRLPAPD